MQRDESNNSNRGSSGDERMNDAPLVEAATGAAPTMQAQARAVVNPFGPPPPPEPPVILHGFLPQYENEDARRHTERLAARDTQRRISNCLAGSQVVYNWPHDPTAAFVMGLLHGGFAGTIQANVHGHALHEFDGNWDWQTPIPTSPWRAYTLGPAVGFVVAWNDVVATNFAEDQQQ